MTPVHLQIVQNYVTCHKELRHGSSKPWYRIEITARVRKSFKEDAKTFSAIYREAIVARKFLWNFQAFHCIILYYTFHYILHIYHNNIYIYNRIDLFPYIPYIIYSSIYISIYIYEPPSKSIVYAWYKNISYRSLGGPYRFPVFCSNQHEILQKCKGISFTDSDLNCRGWIKGLSLSLRLQPCWGAI